MGVDNCYNALKCTLDLFILLYVKKKTQKNSTGISFSEFQRHCLDLQRGQTHPRDKERSVQTQGTEGRVMEPRKTWMVNILNTASPLRTLPPIRGIFWCKNMLLVSHTF